MAVSACSFPGGARLASDSRHAHKPEGWTRFVCFSDTHGLHDRMPDDHLVPADVLIHAGDFTNAGDLEDVKSFSQWLGRYPSSHKIVIAGNHDVTFDERSYAHTWRSHHAKPYDCTKVKDALSNCVYLQDESVHVCGYTVYGSPWQPLCGEWAFSLPQGPLLASKWEQIPRDCDIDILVSHGPPYGRFDKCRSRKRAGCRFLLEAIEQRLVPVIIYGHIHEAYGVASDGISLFANASTCTYDHRPINPPIVLDLPPAMDLRASIVKAAASVKRLFPTFLNTSVDDEVVATANQACKQVHSVCVVCDGTGSLLSDPCPLCNSLAGQK